MLKMATDAKLTRARATSVASVVMIESESNLWTELKNIKILLEASWLLPREWRMVKN